MHDLMISWSKPKKLRSTLVLVQLLILAVPFYSPSLFAQPESTQQPEHQESVTNTRNEDLIRTQNQLAYLEATADAYDSGIAELSLEIGNLLARQGKNDEALSAFRRALHVSRINYGLDSDLQLPVLEAILGVQTETNQIQSAGDTLNRIYRVHQENYPSTDPATINLLMRIGIWHFSAYFFKIDSLSLTHLIKARRALGLAHDFSRKSEQANYNFDLYNMLAMTDHGLAAVANSTDSNSSDAGNFTGSGPIATSMVSGSYRRGKLLLEDGIEEAQNSGDIASLVRATLLYGDWNQMFNKRHAAQKMYVQAYEVALSLPEGSPLRASFNRPHRLPDFNSAALAFGPKDVEIEMVPVVFDVDKWGASSNIKIQPKADGEKFAYPVKRAARTTVRSVSYRPAIVDGQPIDSIGVKQTVIVEL